MDRRAFIQACSILALPRVPGWPVRLMPSPSGVQLPRRNTGARRVVVAGGGIIGSSIAYHLAARAAEVTLLEKTEPASGATSKSFAWINATFSKRPWSYFLLNRLGIEAWQILDQQLGGALQIQWGGSLEWYTDADAATQLKDDVRHHQEWGYPVRLIDPQQIPRLERGLTTGRVQAASFAEIEGHIDPVHAVQVLLDHARRHGARVESSTEVAGLDLRNGRLRAVKTTRGEIEADALVVACGVDTPRVAAMAGLQVPLKDSPGVLVHTAPADRLIQRVVLAPGAHMKQKPDGRVVAGVGFGGGSTTDTSAAYGERMLREATRFLPRLKDTRVEKVTLGWRPLPQDDHPIVGFAEASPSIYVTVMHSGVTLGALIGRLAATEMLDGVDVELLRPYRLARFV